MPHAIADSDDDGDCEDLVQSFNRSDEQASPEADIADAWTAMDGAVDTGSTGSTGKAANVTFKSQ